MVEDWELPVCNSLEHRSFSLLMNCPPPRCGWLTSWVLMDFRCLDEHVSALWLWISFPQSRGLWTTRASSLFTCQDSGGPSIADHLWRKWLLLLPRWCPGAARCDAKAAFDSLLTLVCSLRPFLQQHTQSRRVSPHALVSSRSGCSNLTSCESVDRKKASSFWHFLQSPPYRKSTVARDLETSHGPLFWILRNFHAIVK